MAVIHEVTDATFEQEVLLHHTPVLVDFYATHCGPCQGFEMTLNSIVDKYEGKVKFCKLNIASSKKTANQYGATGTPTSILFNRAVPLGEHVGACSSVMIEQFIAKLLPQPRG